MCRRICLERVDFRIASRITFVTFVKGYGQSHKRPAPCFFIPAKFDTSSGSWKGENNWWCEVIYHCWGINVLVKSTFLGKNSDNEGNLNLWKNWKWTIRSYCKVATNQGQFMMITINLYGAFVILICSYALFSTSRGRFRADCIEQFTTFEREFFRCLPVGFFTVPG